MSLKSFYPRRNKANKHNNIISIFSFQNRLNQYFSSNDFCFKNKIMEGIHQLRKIYFFNFRPFFSNHKFLRLRHFFVTQCLSNQLKLKMLKHPGQNIPMKTIQRSQKQTKLLQCQTSCQKYC